MASTIEVLKKHGAVINPDDLPALREREAKREQDWLWQGGRGEKTFGKDFFTVVVSVRLRLGNKGPISDDKPVAVALSELPRLQSLQLSGPITDDWLRNFEPSSTLHSLVLADVTGGSRQAWLELFRKSYIESLELSGRSSSDAELLEAVNELKRLQTIELVGGRTMNDRALRALLRLRPKRQISIYWLNIDADDESAQGRIKALGSRFGSYHRYAGEEWKAFQDQNTETIARDTFTP